MMRSLAITIVIIASSAVGDNAFGQTLYWTQASPGQIWRADADGSNPERIIPAEPVLVNPRGIVYDPVERKIYWIDDSTSCTSGKVVRANDDGSQREDICGGVGVNPSSLFLDYVARKLYIVDGPTNTIIRTNLDGSNPEEPRDPNFGTGTPTSVTLVPPACTVPALGNIGLAVMVMLLVFGGAGVMARRKRAATPGCDV